MTDIRERRQARRVTIGGHLSGRARVPLDVRFLDLSLTGVRIEHLDWLRPGSSCTLEFPPALGSLVLSARIVHSAVVGSEQSPEGYRLIRCKSGLVFVDVSAEQQAVLVDTLERLSRERGGGKGG